MEKSPELRYSWSRLYRLTIPVVYAYIFMEWLFLATKPSFMSSLGVGKKLEILLFFSAAAAVFSFVLLLPLEAVSLLPGFRNHTKRLAQLGALLPALVLASLSLLMIDNFTYTIFQFGIVSSQGFTRGVYAGLFVALLVLSYRYLLQKLGTSSGKPKTARSRRFRYWPNVPMIAILGLSLWVPWFNHDLVHTSGNQVETSGAAQTPNILLITVDGLNASHLPMYGYDRNTTPNLKRLSASLLVAENAFPNANKTAGSIVSIYTGKYPSQTRFYYPPDILRNEDAYEHLPGILRSLGYYTVEIAHPYFVDAYTFNLLDGFDVSNGRSDPSSQTLLKLSKPLDHDFAYFLYEIDTRIISRLKHIFYIQAMTNPYATVVDPKEYNDQQKMNDMIQTILKADQPVFVHIHWLGTHGETFDPPIPVFSRGQDKATQGKWNQDFYDDIILEFDRQVGVLIDRLSEKGLLDHTVLVIGSDHGQQWTNNDRIPLLIRFPNGEYAGRIKTEVQNLDIAPTIIDYLGLSIPSWMSGQSLIDPGLQPRPIISINSIPPVQGEENWIIAASDSRPPFYELGEVDVIYCRRWYKLNVRSLQWSSGMVVGDTAPCLKQTAALDTDVFVTMKLHLQKMGFDVSSLKDIPLAVSKTNP